MRTFTEGIWADLRYGVRLLVGNPGFTAVAVLSLALGIGANTALFSVTDALMFRMLPVKDAREIVAVRTPLSYPAYRSIRDRNQTLSGMFAFSVFPANYRIDEEAEQGFGQMVSGNFYSVLGVNAVLGRVLTPDDDRIPGTGGPDGPVGVITYQYWNRRFALDPSVIGRTITFNGVPVTIVGVTPPYFSGVLQVLSPDVTVAISLQPRVFPSASTELWAHGDEGSFLNYDLTDTYGPPIMARLKPGVSVPQAEAELTLLYQQILSMRADSRPEEQRRRENAEQKVALAPGGNGFFNFEPQERVLVLLVMSAVPAVVLLIACANVATLLLARAAARQREVAVRLAIGAGRLRLIRQFLSESMVLALVGGAAGLLAAEWGRRLLLNWMSSRLDIPFALRAENDARTLLFTLGVSMAAATIFGVVPAIRAARALPANELKTGGRNVSGGRGWETAKMLVAAQVALSLLLLVCAGLLIRTVRNLQLFDPGFDRDQLYLISTNFLGYKGPQTGRLMKEMRDRTASLPGARAVGIAQDIPPSDRRLNVTVDGAPALPTEKMYVDRLLVGPGFFEVMGIPLIAGRVLTERDDERAPNVCVVSATMARTFFPDRSPLGRHFRFKRTGAEYEVEVVGVAKDLKKADPNGEWRPVYCPMLQDLPSGGATVLVRTGRDAAPVIAEARRRLHAIDNNLFIDVKTMDRRMEDTVFLQRMLAMLSGVFGSLALLLASIGLYGVMAYSVARRTNEVGIRMALGADRRKVIATVVKETMTLVAAGVLLGMGAALAATRLLSSTLFGLTAMDPVTLTFAIAVMLTVALLAGYLPARRAAAVNPVIALRQE
jgi:predicted permease